MEQGTLVALFALAGSFLTVLVTGAVNIWSKYIDSELKVREHQLSLRSTYVTKKIEAGQSFISFNSLRINKTNVRDQFLREIKDKKIKNDKLLKEINSIEEDLSTIRYKEGNFTGLYFDIESLINQSYDLIDKLNEDDAQCEKLLESQDFNNEELQQITNNLLKTNTELQNIYRLMNISIRNELAKYDIL